MTRSSNRKTVLAAASVLLLIGGCCLCPKKPQPPRIRPAVSTKHAEVDMGHQHSAQFLGAANKPIAPCEQDWFRNLLGTTAFGHALACPVDPSTIGLTSVDYSLQIQRGLGAVFGQSPSANPCFNVSPPTPPPPGPPPPPVLLSVRAMGPQKFAFRVAAQAEAPKLLKPAKDEQAGWVASDPDPTSLR